MNVRFNILLITIILGGLELSAHSQNHSIQYLFPPDSAEWVLHESQVIIRFQDIQPDQIENLNSFIKISGEKSGDVSGRIVVSDDNKTIVFYPDTPYSFNDRMMISIMPRLIGEDHPFIQAESIFFIAGPQSVQKKSFSETELPVSPAPSGMTYTPNEDGVIILNGISVPSDFPYLDIKINNNPDPGYIFCNYAGSRYFNLILDNFGSPVFYWIVPDDRRDFKVQETGVLTMTVRQGFGGAGYIALDNTYSIVDSFFVPAGFIIDEHELLLLPNGHTLVTALDTRIVDMSKLVAGGRKNAYVTGYHLIEMDARKNPVLIWRCWDNYQITDAEYVDLTQPNIDYLHMNSIAVDLDGHYLVCPKLLNEITKINHETGKTIWRLGGKKNQFTYQGLDEFIYMQHSIRVLSNGNYTVFDNGNYHTPYHYSRALEFKVDTDHWTVTKVWEYRDSPDKRSEYQGNVQRLPNGNTLINWGMAHLPKITEVRPDGTKAYEMNFQNPVICYRVFKSPWQGKAAVPFLVIEPKSDRVVLLFNKFGDSDVKTYRIYGGTESHPTRLMGTADKPYMIVPPEDLAEGSRYFFRITAVNTAGQESDFSNEENVRVDFIPANKNMLANSEFTFSHAYWNFNVWGSASAHAEIIDGALKVNIEQGGSDFYEIQLTQNNVQLLKGHEYQFEYDAWAEQNRDIEVKVEQAGSQVDYSKSGITHIKSRMGHFIHTFIMDDASVGNARVVFNVGSESADVYIDNVSLMRTSSSKMTVQNAGEAANDFQLHPIHPNPLNLQATVSFSVSMQSRVSVDIFDMLGRFVQRVMQETLASGNNSCRIDAQTLCTGVYFCRVIVESINTGQRFCQVKKLVVMK